MDGWLEEDVTLSASGSVNKVCVETSSVMQRKGAMYSFIGPHITLLDLPYHQSSEKR